MLNTQFHGAKTVVTPALIFDYDGIKENISHMIKIAGSAKKMWPHMKTHKCAEIIKLQIAAGITRFKCATISEAEVTASCGASDVLLAYPLIGPNINRFLKLQKAFPDTKFWAIGDNLEQLNLLGSMFAQAAMSCDTLVDVNVGLDRTGVPLKELENFFITCTTFPGLKLRGFHCYDGQRHETDFKERYDKVKDYAQRLHEIQLSLEQRNIVIDTMVLGTSPSFPCFVKCGLANAYFSPGTLILNDAGYSTLFPDLIFNPAAYVMTRVISTPKDGIFTLDLGVKGIAADPGKNRGIIVDCPHAISMFQNEEHWVFKMETGYEKQTPKIGDTFLVIPTHICPTCALYPYANVIRNNEITAKWRIAARDRELTY